jgi:hypothetical protein
MRREFQLSENDRDFLDRRERPWHAILSGQARWVIIEDFLLPTGYNLATVTVALPLHPSYPDVQIDMAYFSPHLSRTDGKIIRALSSIRLDDKDWQQWSRHRVGNDAWRPGIDNIETHLWYVSVFLEFELTK